MDETRQLARLLTTGLVAEQAALPVEPGVIIPSPERTMQTNKSWAKVFVAAAAIMIAVGGTYLAVTKWSKERNPEQRDMAARSAPGPELSTGRGEPDDIANWAGGELKDDEKKGGGRSGTATDRSQSEGKQDQGDGDKLKPDTSPDKPADGRPYYDPTSTPDPRRTSGTPGPASGPPAKSAPGRPGLVGPVGGGGYGGSSSGGAAGRAPRAQWQGSRRPGDRWASG